MYLHENKEEFRNTIEYIAAETGQYKTIIEKDYYVTLILRLLSERQPNCVFKGGTSLSKSFHIIDRFSEDVDISFSEHLGDGKRHSLKHKTIKPIADKLGLTIPNFDSTHSRLDLNAYQFAYDSVFSGDESVEPGGIEPVVKLEISLIYPVFPTVTMPVGNYINDYLEENNAESLAEDYGLSEFAMQLQSPERTFIDKLFAIADSYMKNQPVRCSRHLYDITKLSAIVSMNTAEFSDLFGQVRNQRHAVNEHRRNTGHPEAIYPSAEPDMNLPDILLALCKTDFYKKDFAYVTKFFINDSVSYQDVMEEIEAVAERLRELPDYH